VGGAGGAGGSVVRWVGGRPWAAFGGWDQQPPRNPYAAI